MIVKDYALHIKVCAEAMLRHAEKLLSDERIPAAGVDWESLDIINRIGAEAGSVSCLTGYFRDRVSMAPLRPIMYHVGGAGGGAGGGGGGGSGGKYVPLVVTQLQYVEEAENASKKTATDPLEAAIMGKR